jgi:hypothetical protein
MSFQANYWFVAQIPCYAAEIPVYARTREFMSNDLISRDPAARQSEKRQIRHNFVNSLLNSLLAGNCGRREHGAGGYVDLETVAKAGPEANTAGHLPPADHEESKMRFNQSAIRTIVTAAALAMTVSSACAFDETKYPDWSGQWMRPRGVGTQWDQTKPSGLGQQAPLRPEYFERLKASLADQAAGGQGLDNLYRCIPNGMPRVMSFTFPVEFVILPNITYVNFEIFMPRRIYTDGRSFPTDEEPSFMGYSIGKWLDTDGDGRFDTLEVETRNFKGPRTVESTGIPLHDDNETVVRERISLDKTDNNMMHNEITIIDHALTQPWTVNKHYSRQRKVLWFEASCNENNHHVVIGDQNYFVSGDGYLMPARKDQPPPDLRYFKQTRK